jgi:hypothetical protein
MGKPQQSRKKSGAAVKSLRQRHADQHNSTGGVTATIDVPAACLSGVLKPTSLPPCIQQLWESTDYAVLEDACSDVSFFALQAKHNEAFLHEGVPQRLAQLLLFTSPYPPEAAGGDVVNKAASDGGGCVPHPHKGILYMQIAAADALRSLVTNSEQDRVVDALMRAGVVDPVSGMSFADGLAALVRDDWTRVQEARRRMTPSDWMDVYYEDNEEEDDGNNIDDDNDASGGTAAPLQPLRKRRDAGNTRNVYFTLLRHLEESLTLVGVCVEANEGCAGAFSSPAALCLLLEVLRVSTTTTWETLLHPSAQYYTEQHDSEGNVAAVSETVLAMRAYKRREACLLAALAVSTSDVLLLLSPESPSLAHVLTAATTGHSGSAAAAAAGSSSSSPVMTAEQSSFLNTAVDAVDLRGWLAAKPPVDVQLHEKLSDETLPGFAGPHHTVVALERERVLYDLLRATLSIQGILLHIAPEAANVQRVLPLLCDALQKVSLPMHVWCSLLPILMDTCECGDEEVKSAVTTLATHRLRATQSTVRLLHVVVNVVGEKNDERLSAEQDDEAAFAANPLAPLLQSGNLFYSFGILLKDVLWVSQSTGNNAAADVVTRQAQQRALRAEATSNAAVTSIQMLLLSIEVNVWEVASTLLLMLPVASLGDPSLTWRALMLAVQHRYALHLDAAAAASAEEQQNSQSQLPDRAAQVNIIQHSASAHQLVWMQLESLVQMLWTVQRKQSKVHGGVLAALNDVQATSTDVDVLVRVSWESTASAALKQACVGTVGLLCASMQHPEAVATATRFALAVVANGGPALTFNKTLLDSFGELAGASVPTGPAERHAWMHQLSIVDAAATVRSEAANTLVDLFLDERYDAAVYWPLGVQEGLKTLKLQLAAYAKRRAQLDKETKRKYHLSTETPDAEQWAEILENLDGFLPYKLSHRQ